MQNTKRQAQLKPQRKEIAKLLDEGKEVTARALTEQFIRDEKAIQAYSQLDIFCEQFLARLDAITREVNMPKDLIVCLCSLVYAAPRVDVEELKKVAANLELKYGTLWADSCHSNLHGQVHPQVFSNLSIGRAPPATVDESMVEIAKEFEIDWRPLVPTPTEQELELTYRAAKELSSIPPLTSPKAIHASNAQASAALSSSSAPSSNHSISNQQQVQKQTQKGMLHTEPSAPYHDGHTSSEFQVTASTAIPISERSTSPPIEFLRLHGLFGGSSAEEELIMIDMLPSVPSNMAVSMDRVPIASEGGVIVTHEEDEDDALQNCRFRSGPFNDSDETSETLGYHDSSLSITEEDIYDEIITWDDIPDGPIFASSDPVAPSLSSLNPSHFSTPKDLKPTNIETSSIQVEDPLLARFNRLKKS